MSSRDRKRSRKMFQHLRRGRYDQAMFHAVDGHPDLMKMYYEGKHEAENLTETSSARNQQYRNIEINGEALSHPAWEIIRQLENNFGETLPDGSYWYDVVSGAFGIWGNATWFFLPPNLSLAGPLHPHCSGPQTGVFINGRDIHPLDLQTLNVYIGYVQPGFYYLDSYGNLGVQGQPPAVNLRNLMGM